MRGVRLLAIVSVLALVPASAVRAQAQRGQAWSTTAYESGHSRGLAAGDNDGRRGEPFNVADESDYRRADAGYRSQYGNVDRYRAEFRRGFEAGYRTGYERYRRGGGPWTGGYGYDDRGRGGYGDDDRGRGRSGSAGRYGGTRYDLAFEQGFNDGYEEGSKDGRGGRRNDPLAESRYRNADRGYEGWYGPRDLYRRNYREAFIRGYEQGWRDGRRYDNRYNQTPWWWPFAE